MNESFSLAVDCVKDDVLLDPEPEKSNHDKSVTRRGLLGFYDRRKTTIRCCCCCFWVVIIIMLPLIFAVIIPAVVRNAVENASVNLQSVNILYPQNNKVQLSVSLLAPEITGSLAWSVGVLHSSASTNYLTVLFKGYEMFSLGKSNVINLHNGPLNVDISGSVNSNVSTEYGKALASTSGSGLVDIQANGKIPLSPFDNFPRLSVQYVFCPYCCWCFAGQLQVYVLEYVDVTYSHPYGVPGFNNFSVPPPLAIQRCSTGCSPILPNFMCVVVDAVIDNDLIFGVAFGQSVSAKAFDPVTGTEMAFATVFNATIVPMSSFPIRAHVNLNLTALIATASARLASMSDGLASSSSSSSSVSVATLKDSLSQGIFQFTNATHVNVTLKDFTLQQSVNWLDSLVGQIELRYSLPASEIQSCLDEYLAEAGPPTRVPVATPTERPR